MIAFSTWRVAANESFDRLAPQYWRELSDTTLRLDDWGTLQGATLVERLRTVGGQLLDATNHIQRLKSSAQVLGITWPDYLDEALLGEVIDRNRSKHGFPDFGLVILLTPGCVSDRPSGSRPTVIVHSTDLHWSQLSYWYQHGQPLFIAPNRNVPASSWPTQIKTRCRLHYYLADQFAAAQSRDFAGALMLSSDDLVTESSVANVLVVSNGELVSPPMESVLHGVSLKRTLRLAQRLGIPCRCQPISVPFALQSDGLLLTGSSGCLWTACSLDQRQFAEATAHPLYLALRNAWCAELNLDYVQQALELS